MGVTRGKELAPMEGTTPEALFQTLLGLGTPWKVVRCEFEAVEGVVRQ